MIPVSRPVDGIVCSLATTGFATMLTVKQMDPLAFDTKAHDLVKTLRPCAGVVITRILQEERRNDNAMHTWECEWNSLPLHSTLSDAQRQVGAYTKRMICYIRIMRDRVGEARLFICSYSW